MKRTCYVLWIFASIASLTGQTPSTSVPPFTVTISAVQPEAKVGEPAMIHIVLKSISQEKITLPEVRQVGRGEMNYRITVESSDGGPVQDSDFVQKRKNGNGAQQHSVLFKDLNYGEEVADDADLNNVVKITVPGDYVVQVERVDGIYGDLHVKSNKLTVHVRP